MPKSSKKKKEKAADFSKAKLKLGKGKQTPSNAIDTSFKARSIALPSQTIAMDRNELVPTTKRKLTFEGLIAHLKHYNAATRKDAILGLRELFENHSNLVLPSLTPLLNACVRLVADEDGGVRKGLLSFFSWLLPRIPQDDLIPHAQLLLLFTTSAQTHIFPEIRVDAIRFLDVFLEVIPDVVTEGWAQGSTGHGHRVLEGYLGVLSAGTAYNESGDRIAVQATSTASVILSPASKLVVLKSLHSFLKVALANPDRLSDEKAPNHDITMTSFMSSAFTSERAFLAFDLLLQSRARTRNVAQTTEWRKSSDELENESTIIDSRYVLGRLPDSWSYAELNDVGQYMGNRKDPVAGSSTGRESESAYMRHLIRTLHPTLTSTFLDCAPSVFSPGSTPSETELQTVCAVAGIAQCLYGSISSTSPRAMHVDLSDSLSTLLSHMAIYFPFGVFWPVTSKHDVKIEQAVQDLNLVFCELTSILLLDVTSGEQQVKRPGRRTKSTGGHKAWPVQVERVCDYVVKALVGEATDHNSLSRAINSTSYNSILPTIWALLNNADTEHVQMIFEAVIEHAIKVSSASAVKRHTIDFIGRLLLLELDPEYHGQFRPSRLPRFSKRLEDWLIQLPKTLWELGSQQLITTEIILKLLLRLSQRSSMFASKALSESLSTRFTPYFSINHNSRGKLPGPFNKLPTKSHLRSLALDVAYVFCVNGSPSEFVETIQDALSSADSEYWLSISAHLS